MPKAELVGRLPHPLLGQPCWFHKMSRLYKPLLTSPKCPTSKRSGGQPQARVSQQHQVHSGPNLWLLRRVGSKSLPPLPAPPPQAVLALGPGIKLPALSLLFGLIMSVSVRLCWLQHVAGKSEHRRGGCVRSSCLHLEAQC